MELLKEYWNIICEWFTSGKAVEFLVNNVGTVLLWIVGIILTVAFSKLIDKGLELINNKIKNDKIKNLIAKARDIIHKVTDATTQTMVAGLKKSGNFNIDKQREAFNKTLTEAKDLFTKEIEKAITKEYKDIDTFVGNEIESHLHNDKKASN